MGCLPFSQEQETSVRISVMSQTAWTDTGYDVEEGQEIYFRATGGISLQKGNQVAYCDPNGMDLKTPQQPMLDENIGALIGKVVQLISIEKDKETGEEIRNEIVRYFYIGSRNRITISINGRLFLGINENIVEDNEGAFTVILEFWN
jgi:hypothetical protein